MNVVNPEAIGLFGLIVTVWVFGLEQLGFGLDKETDHAKLGRNLAHIALYFGGFAQLFTAACLYLFDVGMPPEARIYIGTIFATYGLFWVVVAMHFYNPGDQNLRCNEYCHRTLRSASSVSLSGNVTPLTSIARNSHHFIGCSGRRPHMNNPTLFPRLSLLQQCSGIERFFEDFA